MRRPMFDTAGPKVSRAYAAATVWVTTVSGGALAIDARRGIHASEGVKKNRVFRPVGAAGYTEDVTNAPTIPHWFHAGSPARRSIFQDGGVIPGARAFFICWSSRLRQSPRRSDRSAPALRLCAPAV